MNYLKIVNLYRLAADSFEKFIAADRNNKQEAWANFQTIRAKLTDAETEFVFDWKLKQQETEQRTHK